ncbi:MAG: glycosyltransferase family 2 protein [Chloroflexi bacterium]|nr:glycosyltransferase family 2 protein [Chloroflexota bacterium]
MPEALLEEDEAIWPQLPFVSIIVLNYNTCEHLETCLRSLQKLIYPADKLQLILVDNASTDQSVAYVQAHFASVKLIVNDQNYGFSQGNNIGAEVATGDYIAFLNPDMRAEPRWLIELVKLLLDDEEVAAAGSKILSWDGQTIDFAGGAANFYGYGYQVGREQEATTFNQVRPILFACGGAMLIHRQLFIEVGGFDEDYFAYYEDLDLGWRLWVLGYKVLFAPTSVTYHIHHGSWGKIANEKRRVLYERNAFFTILKNYEEVNLNQTLPVALLLLLKRIYLTAGIDENLFRLGISPHSAAISAPSAALQSHNAYHSRYYLKEVWRTLINEGPIRLYTKFKAELKRRSETRRRAQLPGRMQVDKDLPDQVTIPSQALSYIIAGNDIITLYEKMLKKRSTIQTRRRRPDSEILSLFGRPLDFSELWPEYRQTQTSLTCLFGIDQIFEG